MALRHLRYIGSVFNFLEWVQVAPNDLKILTAAILCTIKVWRHLYLKPANIITKKIEVLNL